MKHYENNNISYLYNCCTLAILSSCQKDDLIYSCDPVVEKAILQELPNIHLMTRSDWLKIKMSEYKAAVFRAFTPTQRYKFISEKLSEVTQLAWSKEEMTHILKLQDFIDNNPQFLNTNWGIDKELQNQFDLFQYKWIESARNYGWTEKQIYAIAFSLDKILNKAGDLLISDDKINVPITVKTRSESGGGGGGENLPWCFCHPYFQYCKAGDPAMWFMSCKTNICKERWPGCQLLLLGTCTGICVSIFD